MTRKRYSEEFKASVVQRIIDGETQMQVAREFGLSSKTVNGWYRSAKSKLSTDEVNELDQIQQLQKELRQAKAEIEFLKKAAAYFAKSH